MTIQEAIEHAEYRYFGTYPMDEAQIEATDILIDSAKRLIALEKEYAALDKCFEDMKKQLRKIIK